MRYFTIVIVIFTSLLTACSQGAMSEETGDATIKQAELTDFEENLLEMTNHNAFIYDVEVNHDEVKEIHTTIDYYEHSELVTTIADSSTSVSESNKDEPLRIVFLQQHLGDHHEQWVSAVMTNSGYSSATNEIERREKLRAEAHGGVASPTSLKLGEKKVVASIVQTDENAFSSRSDITTEEELREVTDYEQVYIMSIELME